MTSTPRLACIAVALVAIGVPAPPAAAQPEESDTMPDIGKMLKQMGSAFEQKIRNDGGAASKKR